MCGLAAIFAYLPAAPPLRIPELLAMSDAMASRGPDGAGLWVENGRRTGFSHRRLAIIDLSDDASQPMSLEDGDGGPGALHIAYNGEIYNFGALRQELEAGGQVFQTDSDTEVLLRLYRRDGPAMTEKLRGMYAFALWDSDKGGLLLARDPFGIKPLYYADTGGTLRIASQVKALLAGGGVDTAPDPAGHAGYFLFGSVPEPHTLYRDIRALPAGSTLWADSRGAEEPRAFFDLGAVLTETGPAALPDLREALSDSVRHHLVSDVPVAVFLSAGLDSATIAGLASEIRDGDLDTVTLGFEEFRGTDRDETPLAEAVSATFGTRHDTIWVTGADFHEDREAVLGAMDQPSIDGVNVYFVAKAAAERGIKVALSGLGGDELFCGYDTFRQIPSLVGGAGWLPGLRHLGKGLRMMSAEAVARMTSPKYAGLLELGTRFGDAYLLRRGLFMPWELPDVLDPDMADAGWQALQPLVRLDARQDPVEGARRKVMALEMTWYMRNQLLRDADWAGMAHGLEIRVPLVDSELFRALAPGLGRPAGPDKQAMAATPQTSLPAPLLGRPKTGFNVPVRDWLRGGDDDAEPERGLRAWARTVYAAQTGA